MKTIRETLVAAAMAYDMRQSKKPGFNRWALPQYLARIDDVCDDISKGADPRKAIVAGFDGRLCNALLKACDLSGYTVADATNGSIYYKPTK